jgi:hypothetical protein
VVPDECILGGMDIAKREGIRKEDSEKRSKVRWRRE